jgi:LPXTG-motif cell wall-anchored protein
VRRTRLVVGLASVASAALIGLAAAPAMAYPVGHSHSLSLTSSVVARGGQDHGRGSGFQSHERVNVYIHSNLVFVGSTIADSNGVAELTFTVPASLPAGHHTVEFVGESSGQVDSAPLTITGSSVAPASSGSTLPFTGGSDVWQLTAIGAGLVLVGGGVVVGVRRRRTHAAAA